MIITIIIIILFSGCINNNENKENLYNVYFKQADYEVIYFESFNIEEGETLDVTVPITQKNIFRLFVRIGAHDHGGWVDLEQDEFNFIIIPPNNIKCIFNPSNEYNEKADKIIPTYVYVNEIPSGIVIKAKNISEANKTATEQYGTEYGTGTWTFSVEWIGDGPLNLDNEGYFELEIWVYPYCIEHIEKK